MKIIGLGHYSRVGKDMLANLLIKEIAQLDCTVVAAKRPFAWNLKIVCHSLYWWAGLKRPEFYDTPEGESARTEKLPTLGKSPVEIWVAFGNAVRDRVFDQTWIQSVFWDAVGVDVLIISDVRYHNEASAIRKRGGTLVKVVRADFGPKDTVADRALLGFDGWDYVAGPTLNTLHCDAKYLAECILDEKPIEQSAGMRRAILDQEVLPPLTPQKPTPPDIVRILEGDTAA